MIVYPGTIYTRAEQVHSEFLRREGIWSVGIGQGVIYIHSFQAISEELKCILLSQCHPAGVQFVVGDLPVGTR